MAIQAAVLFVVVTFLTVNHATSQSCGSTQCSQAYSSSCPSDRSCQLYDNCRTSQSGCNRAIGTPRIQTVDCYDTCIRGSIFNPSIPSQCCADPILLSETLAVSQGSKYFNARVYSPNEAGADVYRLNTFCKYNFQCPNNDDVIEYCVIDFDLEPKDANGNCLDFLRYHFTSTGANVDTDACGPKSSLSPELVAGVHGSNLMLDFRSNRIRTGGTMFLTLQCIPAQSNRAARNLPECTPSVSARNRPVSNPLNPTSAEELLSRAFPTIVSSSSTNKPYDEITVTRKGVVMYQSKLLIVKENGRIRRMFRNINYIRVYNKIEGHIKFTRSASPRGRNFPGYGFLRVGNGRAQFIQTIAEPSVILNDEEEMIVRTLYKELLNRRAFDGERFYFTPPRQTSSWKVDCSVNKLAQRNVRSCTPGVRSAATFFLEKDAAQGLCKQ